jgi:hypothetical protein
LVASRRPRVFRGCTKVGTQAKLRMRWKSKTKGSGLIGAD